MAASRRDRLLLMLVAGVGLLIAGAALLLTTLANPLNGLFRHALTFELSAGLVAWNLLAWAARRVTVGKLPKVQLTSVAMVIWGGFRVALFVAIVTLLICILTGLAIGLAAATTFVKALVLLLFVSTFTAITAGAFLNSVLVVRRWRAKAV